MGLPIDLIGLCKNEKEQHFSYSIFVQRFGGLNQMKLKIHAFNIWSIVPVFE